MLSSVAELHPVTDTYLSISMESHPIAYIINHIRVVRRAAHSSLHPGHSTQEKKHTAIKTRSCLTSHAPVVSVSGSCSYGSSTSFGATRTLAGASLSGACTARSVQCSSDMMSSGAAFCFSEVCNGCYTLAYWPVYIFQSPSPFLRLNSPLCCSPSPSQVVHSGHFRIAVS